MKLEFADSHRMVVEDNFKDVGGMYAAAAAARRVAGPQAPTPKPKTAPTPTRQAPTQRPRAVPMPYLAGTAPAKPTTHMRELLVTKKFRLAERLRGTGRAADYLEAELLEAEATRECENMYFRILAKQAVRFARYGNPDGDPLK